MGRGAGGIGKGLFYHLFKVVASGTCLNIQGKDPVKREDMTLGKQIHLFELVFINLEK